ncbi:MAG: hypothetical protein QXT13_13320 [Pyrobaculum sp.]
MEARAQQDERRLKRLTMLFDSRLLEEADRLAREAGLTRTQLFHRAVRLYIVLHKEFRRLPV